jgi:D-alanyl-D-alanine endopeptidase (penicillin-binding protein 7)
MDHVHTFAPEQDTVYGKELNLGHGEQLKAFDLLRSSIVGSDNDTALGLVATTEAGDGQFVEWMNEKAYMIGMENTHFDDATGLSSANTSTVGDIARLALYAFRQEEIQEPASMREHYQRTVESDKLTRVATTNKLLYDADVEIIGGKTGYITEAGYCLVVQARVHSPEGEEPRDIIAVVLGADSEQGRFDQVKKLILWTQAHYSWE